jgi:phosphomannomutase
MERAIEILPDMGISVILNPLQESTCLFYFSCLKNPKSAAVMITASHNPGEFIGLKIMAPGMITLAMDCGPAGGLTAILAFYLQGAKAVGRKVARASLSVRRYLDAYIDYSMRLAGVTQDSLSGVPILADFLCGAAGAEITEALGYAGAALRTRNLVPDGNFPIGDPNPIIITSIQPTWDIMKRGGYSFGFCYDGDGDRMDVMDCNGEQLAPSFNLSILVPEITEYFKSVHSAGCFDGGSSAPWKPHLYADVKSNPVAMVDQARCGIDVHIIRNGHSFIKESWRVDVGRQYLVAAEESAHYYMNFPYDLDELSKGFAATENSLFFTLLTARMWTEHPERYRMAMERQNNVVREREWPCHFKDESLMEGVMSEVEGEFASRGLSVLSTMEDGTSLDATLMRKGLPEIITHNTDISGSWYQVAQRISRSEEGMARWEVVSSSKEDCEEAVAAIRTITDRYVDRGVASYE